MRTTSSSGPAYYQSHAPPPHPHPPGPPSSRARSHSGRSAVGRTEDSTALALTPYKPGPPSASAEYPPNHYGQGAYYGHGRPSSSHYSNGGRPPSSHYSTSQALVAPGHLQYIPRQPMHQHHPQYYGYPPNPNELYPPDIQYSPPTSKGVSPIRPTYSPPPAPPPAPKSDRSGLVRRKNEPALVVFPVDCPWPPPCGPEGILSEHEARKWISTGTPSFRGMVQPIRCAPQGNFYFYAHAAKSPEAEWEDCAPSYNEYDAFEDMSSALDQLQSIEKPAMSGSHGLYPGTVTISYYTASFGSDIRVIEAPPYKVKLRKVTMRYLLEQLQYLQRQGGFEEVDPYDLYRNLYNGLLHENPHADQRYKYSLQAQIGDLTVALLRPQWINYSFPENQVVSTFFHNAAPDVTTNFFHQLLLSVELHLRIVALQLDEDYDPLVMLPQKVNWDLVLAKRWLEKVIVRPPRNSKSSYFNFKYKEQQIESLRNFAFTLKWPNMFEVTQTLDAPEEEEGELEDKSVNCMAWFTGVMLPGKSIPWIVINALIDCDPDCPEEFRDLPMHEAIGLQYRGSSFWHYETIVGRVMAAAFGVSQIGGWIGPCSQSNDLLRCEVVMVNQQPPKHTIIMTADDVADMEVNSNPLGAYQQTFPVGDYDAISLDSSVPIDTIRIEKLNFVPSASNPPEVLRQRAEGGPEPKPTLLYDASLTFAIGPKSWKVALRYNTPFIAAYPCHKGPHVIFCEYKYRLTRVDRLVDIHDWGARKGFRVRGSEAGSRVRSQTSDSEYGSEVGEDDGASELEEILVVEAYGVCDNAVFARSWCAYWGVAAVTADLKNTCFACCVRQAYAARVSVVILTDSAGMEYEVEEVDRLMENL